MCFPKNEKEKYIFYFTHFFEFLKNVQIFFELYEFPILVVECGQLFKSLSCFLETLVLFGLIIKTQNCGNRFYFVHHNTNFRITS
jgi:hypothetical protein